MKRNTDHVVIDMKKQEWRCNHCGMVWPLQLPTPVSTIAAIGRAFTSVHRKCRVSKDFTPPCSCSTCQPEAAL